MKRGIIATLLILSILGMPGWFMPASAQNAPVAGPVQTFEVEDGHPIGLSPDGSMYAVAIQRRALCVYDTATQGEIACADLEPLRAGIRIEDVVWSPDSTRLAFSENGFQLGKDGDLWVVDAASGELTNLTDDEFAGSLLSFGNDEEEEPTFYLDVAPAWTPNSQSITFSRSQFANGERQGNVLAQVPSGGGEVEILATVPNAEPGAVYLGTGWDPSGKTFYFSLTHLDTDNPENGIWTYDPATGGIAPLALGDDPELGPLALLRVSLAGDRLLAWYPMVASEIVGAQPFIRLVDTTTGELATPAIAAMPAWTAAGKAGATFSPDGQALLFVVPLGDGYYQVWVSDLAGSQPHLLIDGLEDTWLDVGVMPSWGANGTVLLGNGSHGGYLFTIDGIGLNALPSPASPVSNGSAVATPSDGFAAGETVVATGIAPLFASPDPNALLVLVLTPGSEAQILGDLVENEFGRWYPVLDPATQTIGYAQADRLGTAS